MWDNGKSRTNVELKSDNPQSIRENGSQYHTMQGLDQHTRNQQQLSGKNGQWWEPVVTVTITHLAMFIQTFRMLQPQQVAVLGVIVCKDSSTAILDVVYGR